MSTTIKSFAVEQPDFTKSFSRLNADYWAKMHGIMAALRSDARWAVLTALYAHLPKVEPGKGRIEEITGLSMSSVKRARRALKAVGLIWFDDRHEGGSKRETMCYTLADIREAGVAAKIIKAINDEDVLCKAAQPVQVCTGDRGHYGPGTGVTMAPEGGHYGPRTGATMAPEVHKGSSQGRTQGKSKGAAVPPTDRAACAAAPPRNASLVGEEANGLDEPDGEAHGDLQPDGSVETVGGKPAALAAKPVAVTEQLTRLKLPEDVAAWACASAANMEQLLLHGSGAGRGFGGTASTSWRRFGTPDQPNVEAWTLQAFAGFYWWRACQYREKRSQPLAMPDWSKLLGVVRNVAATMTKASLHVLMRNVVQNFDLIRWRARRGGDDLELNETALQHPTVRGTESNLASMTNEQRALLWQEMRSTPPMVFAA